MKKLLKIYISMMIHFEAGEKKDNFVFVCTNTVATVTNAYALSCQEAYLGDD